MNFFDEFDRLGESIFYKASNYMINCKLLKQALVLSKVKNYSLKITQI